MSATGHGKVVSLHIHGRSNAPAISLFNFSPTIKKSILHAPLSSLRELYRALDKPEMLVAASNDSDGQAQEGSEPPRKSTNLDFFAPMDELHQVFAEGFDRCIDVVFTILVTVHTG